MKRMWRIKADIICGNQQDLCHLRAILYKIVRFTDILYQTPFSFKT